MRTTGTQTIDRDTFTRHRGPVTTVAGIPGADAAVSSGYDGAVGYVDLSRRTIELLGYHRHLVNRVAIDPTGKWAATPSSDYTIGLWDLDERALVRVLRGHADDVEDFAFAGDGLGVSVGRDTRVLVWDLSTGAVVREFDGHDKDALSVVCAGDRVYTSGDDMTFRVWDLATGRAIASWGPFETETDTCAVDPARGRAVLGCDDGVIRIFDLDSGEVEAAIEAHASGIKKVAVSPANGDVLSAAYDQRILLWDAETLEMRRPLESRLSVWERSFNWSPDGTRILAGTFDGTALVWDPSTGRCLDEVGDAGEGNACFNEVAAAPDGRIATVSDDGFVRVGLLTRQEARWIERVSPASGRVLANAVTVAAARGLLVAGAHDHTLHVFDWPDPTSGPDLEVRLGEGPVNSVRVCDDPDHDAWIYAACYSGAIARVTPAGEVLAPLRMHEGAVKALRLHPSRPLGVSCSADGTILSWTLDGEVLARFVGHMSIVDDVDLDPSGQLLASVSRDFTLKVYALDDARMLHSISLGLRSPKAVVFPDPNTVVVTNYWGALIKADLGSGRTETAQIAANGISSAARHPEGIAVSSYDGSIYLVDPKDLSVLQVLTGMTQRLEPSATDPA